jgi:Helix-turn-helix domain
MANSKQTAGGAGISPPTPIDPDAGCNELQAALFLGVSVRTLQAWRVRGGGPPYVKIGRTVRYQRRTLLKFQMENTVRSTSEADAREAGQ